MAHRPPRAPQPAAAQGGSIETKETVSAGGAAATTDPSLGSATTATTVPTPVAAPPLLLPRSAPKTLTIASIGVRTVVNPIGLNPDGTLAVPVPGPRYDQAAWYTGSPTPGQLGPAIIEGHVDSAAAGPSVFFKLGAVKVGDEVRVTRTDGSVAVFAVNAVRRFPKDNFPTAQVYGNTEQAALRIITCGGTFDGRSGHYRDNIVVFAHLTGAQRA